MKRKSNLKPSTFLQFSNGNYRYNFNIEEKTEEIIIGERTITRNFYEYDVVKIQGTPTYEKCVQAVIRSIYDENKEFSLINKYNAFVLGISTNEIDKTNYENYLLEVQRIKEMVKADFELFQTDDKI